MEDQFYFLVLPFSISELIVAKALYDYTAAIPEECSFRKGDIVCVTRTQDDGWWIGDFMGTRPVVRGLVPRYLIPYWELGLTLVTFSRLCNEYHGGG